MTAYFYNLSAIRGGSAIVVLCAHIMQTHFLRIVGLGSPLHQLSSVASEYAVIVFFILSGYLIAHSLETNIERNGSLRLNVYVAARIARLYPPFIYAVAVSLLVYFVMEFFGLPGRAVAMRLPGDSYAVRDVVHISVSDIKLALLMLQGMLNINGPLWSLYIEAKMYVLFACVITFSSANRSVVLKLACALICLIAAKAGVAYNPGFAAYAAIWMIGALSYYVWNQCANKNSRILLCLALIIAAEAWNILEDGASPWIVARDVSIVVFISWLLFKLRVRVPSSQRIADCSYSLYATHFPILLLGQSLLIQSGKVSVSATIWVALASTAAALGVALIGGVIEEKKLLIQNWLLSTSHSFKFG